MTGLLIANTELERLGVVDVRIRGEHIAEIGSGLGPAAGETRIDAAGGQLLPGLRDHHIHLMALAAARTSVSCGPPSVMDSASLTSQLRDAAQRAGPHGRWLRGIGYHQSVAGWLDRSDLDRIVADRPVRIQHRSGALWILNSAALEALGPEAMGWPKGVERDDQGRPTGRLHRLDDWLRERMTHDTPPDLAPVGSALASLGVTGLCDATAHNGVSELGLLEAAAESGALPQRILVMGSAELPPATHPRITRHHRKLMLDEGQLPAPDDLAAQISAAHGAGRGVAFHCVTRCELVVALAALAQAGTRPGDRIEHASVAPPDLVALLRDAGVRVVTQPGFLRERGDAYLQDVEARDLPWLYRGRGFIEAGIPLAGGTDAPFGEPDPWAAMRAAVDRSAASGALLSPEEALTPEQALALFTSPLDRPGDECIRLVPGVLADLCLLDRPWSRMRDQLDGACVRASIVGGRLVSGS
jgi:predicted amidohydrolase YtcJ